MAQSQNPEECAERADVFPCRSAETFQRPIGALFTLPIKRDLCERFTAVYKEPADK